VGIEEEMKKTLSQDAMIELLPPEAAVLERACKVMQAVTPDYYHPNWLAYGVAEGWFEAAQVQFQDKPLYVIWYHFSPDGGLIVNAAAAATAEEKIEVLAYALVKLALQRGARYVEFHTARRGLVKKAQDRGWRVESVIMRKQLK